MNKKIVISALVAAVAAGIGIATSALYKKKCKSR